MIHIMRLHVPAFPVDAEPKKRYNKKVENWFSLHLSPENWRCCEPSKVGNHATQSDNCIRF